MSIRNDVTWFGVIHNLLWVTSRSCMNRNNWVTDASFLCSCEYANFIACDLRETESFSHTFAHFTNIICCFDNICSVSKHYKSEWFSNKKPFTEAFQNLCFYFSFFSYERLVSRGNDGAIIVWAATLRWHHFIRVNQPEHFTPPVNSVDHFLLIIL